MATVVERPKISRNFPAKHGAPQILWILHKHGPQTVWEVVDRLKEKKVNQTWRNVQASLLRLREKGEAGVVNWKEERNRLKRFDRYSWSSELRRGYRPEDIGRVLNGSKEVEIWAVIVYDDDAN